MSPFSFFAVLILVGAVAEPIRVYQTLSGRLGAKAGVADTARRRAGWLFCCALPFWLAMGWAYLNIEVLTRCSGDNCIGYMLLATPFPFLYGLAELVLFAGRQRPAA